MKKVLLPFVCLFFLLSFLTFDGLSQTYFQDPTFAPIDLKKEVILLKKFAIQADGKIIVVGSFEFIDGIPITHIARLHSDGRLDNSFQSTPLSSGSIESVAIQPDGKILIVGYFRLASQDKLKAIARFNTDGTIDPTFNAGTDADGERIYEIAFQGTDRFIVVGSFTSFNGKAFSKIARLNLDGSLDLSFIPLDSFTSPSRPGFIRKVLVQADGGILIAGTFSAINGLARKGLARIHQNGSLDLSFVPATRTSIEPFVIALQSDGKLVIAGSQNIYNTGSFHNGIERLNTDGSTDFAFDITQLQKHDVIKALAIQGDGKIVFASQYGEYRNLFNDYRFIRINANGTIDSSFQIPKEIKVVEPTQLAFTNNKFLVAGDFSPFPSKLFQLQENGSLDESFSFDGAEKAPVTDLVLEKNNSILVSSVNKSVNDKESRKFFRAKSDGTIDLTFTPPAGFPYSPIALPDGKVLTVMDKTQLVRLNTDGTVDPTFAIGKLNANGIKIALQKDGKIVVGGTFTTYNGVPSPPLIRLHADGSIDNTFKIDAFIKGVSNFAIREDGKILVYISGISTPTFTPTLDIHLLGENGTLESTFHAENASIFESLNLLSIVAQPDGKVLLGGSFPKLGTHSWSNIARLNADLTIDNTFKAGNEIKFNGQVMKINVQIDGKIVVVGSFNSVNTIPYSGYVKLNNDGSIDTTFKLDGDESEKANAMVLQSEDKPLIGWAGKIVRYTLPLDQTISFSPIADKLASDAPFKLVATASSSLPVSFSVVSGPAIIKEDSLKLTGEAGTVTVRASQGGAKAYKAAPAVEKSFNVQAVLGVEDDINALLKIYPNPTTGSFIVELPQANHMQALQLINSQGQIITPKQSQIGSKIKVERGSLPAGVYILKAFYKGNQLRRKLVIQ